MVLPHAKRDVYHELPIPNCDALVGFIRMLKRIRENPIG